MPEVDAAVEAAVAEAFRQEWGRVVATLIGMTGDWDLAEECAQDAFARALRALAARRHPAAAGRVAHHDGPQPGHRRAAPPRDRGRQAAGGRHAVAPRIGRKRTRAVSGTTGCG